MKTEVFSLEQIGLVAKSFSKWLEAPAVICFSGPLGSGKTRLIKEIIHMKSGAPRETVTSPTFTMLHEYPGIFHFDLYRLKDPLEFERMGWSEHLDEIALIEWSERLGPLLPTPRIDVELEVVGEKKRRITIHETH